MQKLVIIIGLMLIVRPPGALAQTADDPLPGAERVEVTTGDGLVMVGDFYAAGGAGGALPSVMLLHGITSNRHEWEPLVEPLLENGFNVLTVDQRAHGETGGNRDLAAAIGDVQAWLDWLREQPSVGDGGFSILGGSWGAVPALGGCAADPACVTAIAVSPGDFPLLDAGLFALMEARSILFVVGRDDNVLYDTQKLFARSSGEAAMHIYNTGAHASAFVSRRSIYRERFTKLIVDWLREHTGT